MSDVQHHQQHQQWEEYSDLIQRASQSRSDAIQLQKAVNTALNQQKTLEKPPKTLDILGE
jgi:putative SOS response-associated peptidase YedK